MHAIAFLFPGQGAQYPGMGKSFFDSFALARQTVEEAEELLKRSLLPLIINGSVQELSQTRNAQIAIYVVSIAVEKVLRQLFPSIQPAVYAGFSLGEYSAVTSAGYLSFDAGLCLVHRRSELMSEACERYPGGMAVVLGLEAEAVEKLVSDLNLPSDLWTANFNCPGQVAISGTMRGINAAVVAAKGHGAKRVVPLQVQGAFHSGLMRHAEEQFEPYIRQTAFTPKDTPLVMNASGAYVTDHKQLSDLLVQQVTAPVRWEQGVRAMVARGVQLFVEIGCGNVLTGFNKRIAPTAMSISIDKPEDVAQLERALQTHHGSK